MPIFESSSRPGSRSYDELSRRQLRAMVSKLESISLHAAVVITRQHSQEIVTCFKLAIDSNIPTGPGFYNVFIIFETRATTDHPNDAGLVVNTSLDATAQRLHSILDLNDESDAFVNRPSLYWYSHFVVAQRRRANSVEEWGLESSLVQYLLAAETTISSPDQPIGPGLSIFPASGTSSPSVLNVLKRYRIPDYTGPLRPTEFSEGGLYEGVLEFTLVVLDILAEKYLRSSSRIKSLQKKPARLMDTSRSPVQYRQTVNARERPHEQGRTQNAPSSSRAFPADFLDSEPASGPSRLVTSDLSPSSDANVLQYSNVVRAVPDTARQTRVQFKEDASLEHSVEGQAIGVGHCPVCTRRNPKYMFSGNNHMTCTTPGCNTHFCYSCGNLLVQSVLEAEIDLAVWAHYSGSRCRLLDEEPSRLPISKSSSLLHLNAPKGPIRPFNRRRSGPRTPTVLQFECGICFEKHAEDFVSRVSKCNHRFCLNCMKSYVISKLEDKVYPIFCPTCTTDRQATPAEITDALVQTLGLSDNQYRTLTELQMALFSINVECPGCKESMNIDREDYQARSTLVCPKRNCNHWWCKRCRQPVGWYAPEHSCGLSELEDLGQREGWKRCPGCTTMIEKADGCNHMRCTAPSCNTHFCYFCGELIVTSAIRQEVDLAVIQHYRRCSMMEPRVAH
ncbi:hypothetical protein C8R45DRAFT_581638 [Mycena sanguinolenta]|nr:hypothetical protein C8R45DRAFT_581638 [Mycena sanguinolenta]